MSTKRTKFIGLAFLILFLGIVLSFSFSEGISGNDFWWHIKSGQWIINNKTVPSHDIFSWVGKKYAIEWIPHEWLSEVIFYLIFSLFGELGMYVFSLSMSIIMLALIGLEIKDYIFKNYVISSLYLVLFSVIISLFFYGRPQIFSYFLLFLLLKILYKFYNNTSSKCIYIVPLIACLWSNLHAGSAPLVYVLCAIFLGVSLINMKIGRLYSNRIQLKAIFRLSIITVLSVLAIMINPIGIKALIYPFVNMSNEIQMSIISEWASPDAKNIGNILLYYFPILITNIGLVICKKNLKLIDLIIALFFIFLFLRSTRFIILWYIAVAFYGFDYMPSCKIKTITHRTEYVALAICFIVLLCAYIYPFKSINSIIKSQNLITKSVSDKMIKIIKENKPQKLFNDYNTGEMLIYNDIDVFFDSRADLYSAKSIFNDGASLLYLRRVDSDNCFDIDKMLNKYKFDSFLVEKERPLYSYLANDKKYKLIYTDKNTGYFITINQTIDSKIR